MIKDYIYFRQLVNKYPGTEHTNQRKVVAAIQLGRYESGYHFSFHTDFEKDPCLKADSSSKESTLTWPNSILLDSRKEFVAFGTDAENKYTKLVRGNNHHDCYFFQYFTRSIPVLVNNFLL